MDPWDVKAEDGPVVGTGQKGILTFEGEYQSIGGASRSINRRGWSTPIRRWFVGFCILLLVLAAAGVVGSVLEGGPTDGRSNNRG